MTRPSTRSRRRPVLARAVALCLGLAVVGCGATSETAFDSSPPTATDQGTGAGSSTTQPPADPDCREDEKDPNVVARSIAPGGPLATPAEVAAAAQPGGRLAAILERGRLRAGVGADTLLFGYLNPETGNLQGFDVEIAKLVATAIFGDPTRIELIPVTSAQRIPMLQAPADEGVDIVVKTMTINCQRWAQINFSSMYYLSGQTLLVQKDSGIGSLDDVGPAQKICAIDGTTSLKNLQSLVGDDRIHLAPDWTGCLVAFQQGLAAGISTDDTILAGLAFQDPHAVIVDAPKLTQEPYGIGLPKDDELTRLVNAVLEKARNDGTWQRLYDEELAEILGTGQIPPPPAYR